MRLVQVEREAGVVVAFARGEQLAGGVREIDQRRGAGVEARVREVDAIGAVVVRFFRRDAIAERLEGPPPNAFIIVDAVGASAVPRGATSGPASRIAAPTYAREASR